MSAQYIVVQFLPDAATGERINIGVIVWDHREMLSSFVKDWRRVSAFAGSDVAFLRSLSADVEKIGKQYSQPACNDFQRRPDAIVSDMAAWNHSVQLTEPRGSTLPAEELLNRVRATHLREFRRPDITAPVLIKSAVRGRSQAVRIVKHLLSTEIEKSLHIKASHVVKSGKILQGQMDEHKFDIVLTNGVDYGAVHAISFEIGETDILKKEIDATAWIVEDVRRRYSDLELGVFVLPPVGNLPTYDRAKSLFKKLSADVLTESEVPRWTQKVTRHVGHLRLPALN